MSQTNGRQDKGFAPWDGNLNKLFETLQNVDGSSQEHYNHVIAKLLQQLGSSQLYVFGDISYILDPIRGKYLSTARPQQTFSYFGMNQKSRYLKIGEVVGVGNGWLMMRKATITGLTIKARNNVNFTIEIRKNDNPALLWSINANAGQGISDMLDIDVEKGDFLQLFINGTAIDHPVAHLELAWRYENI